MTDFEAYPYTTEQLGQLDYDFEHRLPVLSQPDPNKYMELPPAEIDRINNDIKETVIFSILIIDSLGDKSDVNPSKYTIALGDDSVKSHEFRSVTATASPAPDNQTLLAVRLQTGYSINGSLVREFTLRSPSALNVRYLKKADLLDLLRDEQTQGSLKRVAPSPAPRTLMARKKRYLSGEILPLHIDALKME